MLRPVNCRPVFGSNETLAKNVVGNMGQAIKMMFRQLEALRGSRVRCVTMKIDVADPEAGWDVLFKVRLATAEHKQLDTGNTYQRRASRRSLESCRHCARGGPGRRGLV